MNVVNLPDGRKLELPDGLSVAEIEQRVKGFIKKERSARTAGVNSLQSPMQIPSATMESNIPRQFVPSAVPQPQSMIGQHDELNPAARVEQNMTLTAIADNPEASFADRMEAARRIHGGAQRGIAEEVSLLGRIPFFNTINAAAGHLHPGLRSPEQQVTDAMNAVRSGEYSSSDLAVLVRAEEQGKLSQEQGKFLNMLMDAPKNLIEFGVGGGIGRLGKLGKIAEGTGKAAAAARGAGLIAGTQATMFGNTDARAQRELQEDPEASYLGAYAKGALDTAIEAATEAVGGPFGETSGMIKRTGFDGIFNEFLEERMGEVARRVLGLEKEAGITEKAIRGAMRMDSEMFLDALKESAEEMVAFAIIGGAVRSPSAVNSLVTYEDRKKALEKFLHDVGNERVIVKEDGSIELGTRVIKPTADGKSAVVSSDKGDIPIEQVAKKGKSDKAREEAAATARKVASDPLVASRIASLSESSSRTEFANASGLPRKQMTSEMRSELLRAAKDQSSIPFIDRIDQLDENQRGKILSSKKARDQYISELSKLSGKELGEKFGYRNRRKQWILDRVEQDIAKYRPGPTTGDRQSHPQQVQQINEPHLHPEQRKPKLLHPKQAKQINSPHLHPKQTLKKSSVTVEEAAVAPMIGGPSDRSRDLSDAGKKIFDDLDGESVESLVSIARSIGIAVPRKGTRAYKEIDEAGLRADIAASMTQQSPKAKVVKATAEDKANAQKRKQSLESQGKPQGPRYPGAKGLEGPTTTKEHGPKKRTLRDRVKARIEKEVAGKEVQPRDDAEREMVEWAKDFGIEVVFYEGKKSEGGKTKRGFTDLSGGKAYVNVGSSKNKSTDAVWSIVGHEIAHASGLDFDLASRLSKSEYKEAEKRASDRHSNYDSLSEAGKKAEVAAILIQDFMVDPKFRAKVKEEPSLFSSVVEAVSGMFHGGEGKLYRKVSTSLRNYRRQGVYLEGLIDRRVDAIAKAYMQQEHTKPDIKKRFKDALTEVHTAALDQHRIESDTVRKFLRKIDMNLDDITKMNNSMSGDYSSIKNFNAWAENFIRQTDIPHNDESNFDVMMWDMIQGELSNRKPLPYDPKIMEEAERLLIDRNQYANDLDFWLADIATIEDSEHGDVFRELVAKIEKDFETEEEAKVAAYHAIKDDIREDEQDDPDEIPFSEEHELDYREKILSYLREIPNSDKLVESVKQMKQKELPSLKDMKTGRAYGRANPGTTRAVRDQVLREDLEGNAPLGGNRAADEIKADHFIARRGMRAVKDSFLAKFRSYEHEDAYEPLTPVQQLVLDKVINSVGLDAAMKDAESLKDFRDLVQGLRLSRRAASRTLSRRDPIIPMTKEVRNRNAIRDVLVDNELNEGEIQKLLDFLKGMGIDINDKDLLKDDKKVLHVIQQIKRQQPRGRLSDMVYEWYLNSILSGPLTHVKNNLSNAINVFYTEAIRHPMEVAVSKLTQGALANGETRDFAELEHAYKGLLSALIPAWNNAISTFKFEESMLAFQTATGGTSNKFESTRRRGEIPGKFGGFVRTSFRTLSAADEFARTFVVHAQVGTHAYRMAKAEGLKGHAMRARIAALTNDKMSQAWQMAMDEAAAVTFQQRGGPLGRLMKRRVNKWKSRETNPYLREPVRYAFPFSSFMVNSAARSQSFIPGVGLMVAAANQDLLNKGYAGDKVNWDQVLVEQAIGTAVFGLVAAAVLGGDDDEGRPRITGTTKRGYKNTRERNFDYGNKPPMSVLIGGNYYNYSWIEPFSTPLSVFTDIIEGANQGKDIAFDSVPNSLFNQAHEKNYLQGVSDLLKMFEEDENEKGQILANTIVGFVPNAYRQTARNARNTLREDRVRKVGFTERIKSQSELFNKDGYPIRYDYWGREIKPQGYHSTLPYRLMSPAKKKRVSTIPADLAVLRYNEGKPESERWYPNKPTPPKRKGHPEATLEEISAFERETGQTALKMAQSLTFSDPPTDAEIERLKRVFSKARSIASKKHFSKRQEANAGEQRDSSDQE